MSIKKIIQSLTLLVIFLLPIQTRYIWHSGVLYGGTWEYGTFALYSWDLLILVIFIVGIYDVLKNSSNYFVQHKPTRWQQRFFLFLGLFILWTGLSVLWADNKFVALFMWFRLVEAIGFASIIMVSRLSVVSMFVALLSSTIVQALWGIGQFLLQKQIANKWFGVSALDPAQLGISVIEYVAYVPQLAGDFGHRVLRAYGGLPHPNILGGFLCVGLLTGIGLYIYYDYGKAKLGITMSLLILFAGLLVSFSRSAWVAFGIAFIIIMATLWWFAQYRFKDQIREYKIIRFDCIKIVFFLMALGLVIFLWQPHAFATRLGLGHAPLQRLEQKSIDERLDSYNDFNDVMQAKPIKHWLLGTGIGNYTYTLAQLKPSRQSYGLQPVHNMYVLIVAELGVVGILLFIGIISAFLGLFITKIREYMHLKQAILSITAVMVLGSFLVIGLFDHYVWTLSVGIIIFWLMLGVNYRVLSQ